MRGKNNNAKRDSHTFDREPADAFTVSIGVTGLGPADASAIDLFMRADAALYAAKAGGRNRVCLG